MQPDVVIAGPLADSLCAGQLGFPTEKACQCNGSKRDWMLAERSHR
jgi:hypothetical protein